MKVYGIIKNNSLNCSAKNIKIKVLLKKDETIMQETLLTLRNVYISPGKTGGFSEKFEIYESLLDIQRYTRRLKSGVEVFATIVSAN